HDRRNARQRVDNKTNRAAKSSFADFGQVNADTDSEWQTNHRRQQQQHERTENRISDAATYADGPWHIRQKTNVERTDSLSRDVRQNDEQRADREQRAQRRQTRHKGAIGATNSICVVHYAALPTPPDFLVTFHTNTRAIPFTTNVTRN